MILYQNPYMRRGNYAAAKPIGANRAVQKAVPQAGVSGQITEFRAKGEGANGLSKRPVASFITLEVRNDNADTSNVILFDATNGYATATNRAAQPAGVNIRGITTDYQVILNRLVTNGMQFTHCRINITVGNLVQLDRNIEAFTTSFGTSQPIYVDTFYPNYGLTEYQFQQQILTFPMDLVVDNDTALDIALEGSTTFTLSFFNKAEFSRIV